MMAASATDIIARAKRKVQLQTVELAGGDSIQVYMKSMSAQDRMHLPRFGEDYAAQARHVIAATCCDENGARLFSDKQLEELFQGDGGVAHALCERGLQVSGIGNEAVEAAMGNSKRSPTG